MGFIKDIENMPNEYAYSKMFFERWYRPQFTTVIIAGDVIARAVLPIVEKYWGGWKSGSAEPAAIPAGASAGRSAVRPRPLGERHAAVGDASRFPARRSTRAARIRRRWRCSASLAFGQTSDLYKKLVVAEQKVDELEVDVPSSFDPSLFTVFARVKNAGDARVRPRSDSRDVCRSRTAAS